MATDSDSIVFAGGWVDANSFERAISNKELHEGSVRDVRFVFPPGCKIMVDAGVRLLSMANQLDHLRKVVTLEFADGILGTMGYLNRMGFFDSLLPGVAVAPDRPPFGADPFRGQSSALVEIASISPTSRDRDHDLPGRLAETLEENVPKRSGTKALGQAAFTVFAELIDNIHNHSRTPLPGCVALQVYKRGGRVKVVVSDSGVGILETLKPVISAVSPLLAQYSDTDLIVEAFRRGVSRHGGGRGCGLKACADHALKFKAELDVRLPRCRVHLLPSADGYRPNIAFCSDNLPLLWGTHVAFDFRLDM